MFYDLSKLTKTWMFRFADMFPDVVLVREVQAELDLVIENGVVNIVQLLKNRETEFSTNVKDHDEDAFEVDALFWSN